MAVSKHNLWKRQKHGLMKLVRSHSDWLQKRREMKIRKRNVAVKSSQWWDKPNRTKPVVSTKDVASSAKRTQVGKKI